MTAAPNRPSTRPGTRPANRIAVAIMLNGIVLFGAGRGAAQTGDSLLQALGSVYSQPAAWTWTALVLAYSGLSPVVLPELVSRRDRLRPPTAKDRVKVMLFYGVLVWGLVALAGATTTLGAADALSKCATAPVTWLLMAAMTVYCLLSPAVLPVLWDEEKDS
ncbi:hypothetical protein [Streptomyces antarcticus]|uniref:hypothetical protein n=1 Tax=Streptomyces antarcticus TaxID=2996458 RepID=UPI00226F50FA|nr:MULTISPECIES: hypothetical protein [unclassified Streptomyces]MCY0946559.1 hypothetical protein [Streptomyces sp. H34-AA3]MCZ4086113.1 hypothetical protein [Streptomyces sp. H34-S5]